MLCEESAVVSVNRRIVAPDGAVPPGVEYVSSVRELYVETSTETDVVTGIAITSAVALLDAVTDAPTTGDPPDDTSTDRSAVSPYSMVLLDGVTVTVGGGAGRSAIVHAAHEFAALTEPPVVGAAGSYDPLVQPS
jgi:hypothetical protein